MTTLAHSLPDRLVPARSQATPTWRGRLLGAPLAVKLAGANAIIVVAFVATVAALGLPLRGESSVLAVAGIALAASIAANVLLVTLALRPLRTLETTAERVWEGDLGARVPASPLADRNIRRVGEALNTALDGLAADRGRVRTLAATTVRTAEAERSRIARELHDSLAQSLAALTYQLSAAAREATDEATRAQIEEATATARSIVEEVRALAQSVHPRVLDDLGLEAALHHLARVSGERSDAVIEVAADGALGRLPAPVESVLYRVAHEAVTNALRHGDARRIGVHLSLTPSGDRVALTVTDDGRGFDLGEAERRRPGMGMFTMRERVGLVDGRLEIATRPGDGTCVRAIIPVSERDEPGGSFRA